MAPTILAATGHFMRRDIDGPEVRAGCAGTARRAVTSCDPGGDLAVPTGTVRNRRCLPARVEMVRTLPDTSDRPLDPAPRSGPGRRAGPARRADALTGCRNS